VITVPTWLYALQVGYALLATLTVGGVVLVAAHVVKAAIRYQYTWSPPRPPSPPKTPAPAAVAPVSVLAGDEVPPSASTGPTRIDRRAATG
jgi:hypothetical protein